MNWDLEAGTLLTFSAGHSTHFMNLNGMATGKILIANNIVNRIYSILRKDSWKLPSVMGRAKVRSSIQYFMDTHS